MKTILRLTLAMALLAGFGAAAYAQTNAPVADTNAPAKQPLPKLLDLGAGKCIPCKMMVPVLEGLKTNYAGRLEVQFIDVLENPDALKQYGVQIIPTQIFFSADGRELFRHEGFFGREDILTKWKELGVNLETTP